MPKNELKKEELKNRVLKLKNDVYDEPDTPWQGDRDIYVPYLDPPAIWYQVHRIHHFLI